MGGQGWRHMHSTYQGRRSGRQSTWTNELSRWRRARGPNGEKADSVSSQKDAGGVRD
ncbi:hypothetical protein B0H34DRAFT_729117, partial [Crassisporium funariophilum]